MHFEHYKFNEHFPNNQTFCSKNGVCSRILNKYNALNKKYAFSKILQSFKMDNLLMIVGESWCHCIGFRPLSWCHRDGSLTSWLLRSYSLQYYSFNCRKMGFGFLMCWQVRYCGAQSWRNRAWIRKSWVKRREFKKKVLTLPTILKINNGLNGYHWNWWTGIDRNM